MKFAVVAPVATATLAGTVAAAVLSLASVTVLCAAVPTAGALKVTVAIEFVAPPGTMVGFKVTETIDNAFTVNVAVADAFNVAVMTGLAGAPTT